jgi:hypothetical protein
MAFSIHLLAKVLIIGNQNPVFIKSFLDNVGGIHTTRLIINRENPVSLSAQPLSHFRPRTFIRQEAHLRCLHRKWHEGCIL